MVSAKTFRELALSFPETTEAPQGATYIELSRIRKSMLPNALTCAYLNKAPKALAAPFIAGRDWL
jgi:hypothetical protein